jgi:hypothetical protein
MYTSGDACINAMISHNVSKMHHQGVPDITKYGFFPTAAIQKTQDHHTKLHASKNLHPQLDSFSEIHLQFTLEPWFFQTCKLNDSHQVHDTNRQIVSIQKIKNMHKDKA